jgi:hypothetical protein
MNDWSAEEIYRRVERGDYNPRVRYTTMSNVKPLFDRIALLEAAVKAAEEMRDRAEAAERALAERSGSD